MKNIHVLHISDIHISHQNYSNMGARVSALLSVIQEEKMRPDIIIISGDIANKGKESEYELFEKMVASPMLDYFSLSASRLILVPGNHDVDRDAIDKFQQAGVYNYIGKPEEMDDLWRQTAQRAKFTARQDTFYRMMAQKGFSTQSCIVDLEGVAVGVACLNSAWLSASDQDRAQIAITRAQIEEAYQKIENADLKLAVWHHPWAWLHDSDAARVRVQVFQKFELCLTGHLHDEDGGTTQSPDGQAQVFTAPAFYARGEQAGAMIYNIQVMERSLTVNSFKWSEKKSTFVRNTDFASNGQWNTNLCGADTLSARAIKVRREIGLTHRNDYTSRLSRHLPPVAIGKRELSIDERFLSPYIVNVSGRREKHISIQEIVRSSVSFVIESLPQAGKTALLDRIGLKIVETGGIAIPVEFADLADFGKGKKGAIDMMSQKLSCSKADAKSIFEGNVSMLIDNCNFQFTMHEWKLVFGWQEELPGLRVIAAGRYPTLPQPRDMVPSAWRFLNLRPLPVAVVRKEVSRLERIVEGQYPSATNLQTTLTTLVEAELPRWPWVILLLFELAQRSRVSDVRSVEGVLRKYSDLRLGTFETAGADRPVVRARMLRLLATDMLTRQVKNLPRADVVALFQKQISNSGLESNGKDILTELLSSQLLTEFDGGVEFTFFVLQEFFHAEYLRENLWKEVKDLDLDSIVRKSGSLIFFAEMVELPELLKHCLSLANSVKGTTSENDLIESLSNLRLPSVDANSTIEKAKAAIMAEDEIERVVTDAEAGQHGARERRALSTPTAMSRLEQFVHAFTTSVAIMRGSRWLEKDLKRQSITQCLELAVSIVAEIASDTNLVRIIAAQEPDQNRRREVTAVVNAIFVLIVAGMLAVLGAGRHLAVTLAEMFNEEKDDIKRLMLLMWYVEIGGDNLEEMVEDLVTNAKSAFIVNLITTWLYAKFVTVNSFGDSAKTSSERLLRIAAEERSRRHALLPSNYGKDEPRSQTKSALIIKAETERIVQSARRDRDTKKADAE